MSHDESSAVSIFATADSVYLTVINTEKGKRKKGPLNGCVYLINTDSDKLDSKSLCI